MNIQIHKNNRGPSILAQLTKVCGKRGLVTVTFWWNNTTTQMDAFGNTKKFVFDGREPMRAAYRSLVQAGYEPVGGKVTV